MELLVLHSSLSILLNHIFSVEIEQNLSLILSTPPFCSKIIFLFSENCTSATNLFRKKGYDKSHTTRWEVSACDLLSDALRTGGEWMTRLRILLLSPQIILNLSLNFTPFPISVFTLLLSFFICLSSSKRISPYLATLTAHSTAYQHSWRIRQQHS